MNESNKLILIADYNSSEIKGIAELATAKYLLYIGSGHVDNNDDNPDSLITFYELADSAGEPLCIRVADSTSYPVWEDEDSEAFADLAEQCGVTLN